MSNIVIKVENLSKIYRLGEIGTGSIGQDVDRWFKTKILGKEDPFLKIGEANDRANKGNSDIVYSLRDINFEVQQGDAVGIIGRNGAGKSTLLKILSRVTTPTTGKINIKGRVASLLEVGTGFHPELTGRENIYLNGAILGMRRREIDRKLDEIIDFSGVERYIDTPVKRYSSGMYVRLAFAVAANLESEILIVDEVLAVGDAEFQKKCLGKMGEVSKGEGRTILFVSHNMASVASLCQSVQIFEQGKLKFQGNTKLGLDNFLSQSDYKISDIANLEFSKDEFQLRGVSMVQNSNVRTEFTSKEPMTIELHYHVKQRYSGFRIGFDLIDASTDIVIFRTYHDDMSLIVKETIEGDYCSKLEIPAFLLKEGSYLLSLLVGIHNIKWISKSEMNIPFRVFNTGGVNQIYADDRPGIIMPKLIWETKKTKYE